MRRRIAKAVVVLAVALLPSGCSLGLTGGSSGSLLSESDLDLDWSQTGTSESIFGFPCQHPDRVWERAGGELNGRSFARDDLLRRFAQAVIRVDSADEVYAEIVEVAHQYCPHREVDGPTIGDESSWWIHDGARVSTSVLVRSGPRTIHYFVSTSFDAPLLEQEAELLDAARRAGIDVP